MKGKEGQQSDTININVALKRDLLQIQEFFVCRNVYSSLLAQAVVVVGGGLGVLTVWASILFIYLVSFLCVLEEDDPAH
jgi:hypothetical protein